MLSIRFGTTKDTIIDVDNYFDFEYEDEWLQDEFVQKMILDVDKSEVLDSGVIKSPILGLIPPTEISGGVKALILMLKTDEEIWATSCGDNCAKWITEIAKQKDITISLEHYLSFGDNDFAFRDADTGDMCDNYFLQVIEHGM